MRFVKATVGLVTKLVIFCLIVVGGCTISAAIYADYARIGQLDKEWEATHPPEGRSVSKEEVQSRAKDLLSDFWSLQAQADRLNERLECWHKDATASYPDTMAKTPLSPRAYIHQWADPEKQLLSVLKTED